MQKAFVTGVTGFLGGHLAPVLARCGWDVGSVCRGSSDTSGVPGCCRIERIDMLDPGSYSGSLAGCDAIFHLAGATSARSREAFDRSNAAVTAALLEARRLFAPEAMLVYVSSQSAGGPSGDRPMTPYGASKLLAESLVRKSRGWVIVRPPAVFGPGDDAMLPLFRQAARGFFLSPTGRGGFPLVYVKDLAEFLAGLPSVPEVAGRTLEPSYGRSFDWRDIHGLLQEAAGRRVLHLRVPPPLVLSAGWLSGTVGRFRGACPVFDLHKSRELLSRGWKVTDPAVVELTGWTPATPPEQAFASTMAWARQRL